MQHLHFSKGQYLFREGDTEPFVFYGVLKGEISIRKLRVMNTENHDFPYNYYLYTKEEKKAYEKQYLMEEYELLKVGEGYCFGETSIIFNIPRTASIYATTDVEFFTIDQNIFNLAFTVIINFLINLLNLLNQLIYYNY